MHANMLKYVGLISYLEQACQYYAVESLDQRNNRMNSGSVAAQSLDSAQCVVKGTCSRTHSRMYQDTKFKHIQKENYSLPVAFQSASLLNKIKVKWNDPIDLFKGKYPIGRISHVCNRPVGLTCHLAALFLHGPYRHPLPIFRQHSLIPKKTAYEQSIL